jgi:hypothetical protein
MKTKKQRLLGLNTQFDFLNYPGLTCESFSEAISFLDYDAVIIDTKDLADEYIMASDDQYEGKKVIPRNWSTKIANDFDRVREQIKELLNHGKNVFVIMSRNEDCFVYTGESKTSGTGKNAHTTNYVTEFDVFSFLPIEIQPAMLTGESYCIDCNLPYSTFFNATKSFLYYETTFDAPQEARLLTTPNRSKAISAVFKIGKGNLVLLPCCGIEDDDEDGEHWFENAKTYLDALLELNNSLLSNEEEYELPLWSNAVKMPGEDSAEAEIEKDMAKLKKLEEKIAKDKAHLSSIQCKKRLLTANGTVLEESVKEVLQEIGFTLQKTEKGRSDVIASYKGIDIVAEIKGVSKSAAEKHAAQLEKWVAQFIEENDREPKPILIVNGFCDTPLTERKEEVFPDQMLKYCVARGHVLITTTQLLCLYIEIKNDPSCAESRINELLSCIGKYSRYLDYEKYITIVQNTEA